MADPSRMRSEFGCLLDSHPGRNGSPLSLVFRVLSPVENYGIRGFICSAGDFYLGASFAKKHQASDGREDTSVMVRLPGLR